MAKVWFRKFGRRILTNHIVILKKRANCSWAATPLFSFFCFVRLVFMSPLLMNGRASWFSLFSRSYGASLLSGIARSSKVLPPKAFWLLESGSQKKPVFQASRAIDCNRKQQITLDSSTIRAIYCYLLLSIALMALDGWSTIFLTVLSLDYLCTIDAICVLSMLSMCYLFAICLKPEDHLPSI